MHSVWFVVASLGRDACDSRGRAWATEVAGALAVEYKEPGTSEAITTAHEEKEASDAAHKEAMKLLSEDFLAIARGNGGAAELAAAWPSDTEAVNYQDEKSGWSVLHWACVHGNSEVRSDPSFLPPRISATHHTLMLSCSRP